MRMRLFALMMLALAAASPVFAHGPQIQITINDNKIVTRELVIEEPYSTSLTSPKTMYVMPLREFSGTWYSRPNNTTSSTLPGLPQYPSGPGFAWGYDIVDGGPQAFAEASVLSLGIIDGLKSWNGATFLDAGATQLKVFRGSNAGISTPPENFAITSDAAPFDSLSLAPIAANYTADAHSSLRFALLGDGSSPTSASPDGVYLVGLQVGSSQSGLNPSEPYYFVLYKNADMQQVVAAVQSLGVAPSLVQWVVPEPAGVALVALAMFAAFTIRPHRALAVKG